MMDVALELPKLAGEENARAVLNRWLVNVGDRVEAEQEVVEIITDKAAFTVSAPASGRLIDVRIAEGATAAFGDVLGTIHTE